MGALDGIRAVAVLLVVLFHVRSPGLGGGFLGVDVFFVLSGFLITTLLLRECLAVGRPDLGRFWARRVMRLMPAAFVVVVTVLVWTVLVAPVFRIAGLTADAVWSLLYVGNWRFVTTANYFAQDGTNSPLLHVWSLAVEEQFYLVWPLLASAVALWAALRVRGGSARGDREDDVRARRLTGGFAGLAVVLGTISAYLLWRLWSPTSPDRAYMGTDTKIFEPLMGAALAALLARPGPADMLRRHVAWLGPAGLAGLLAGVALLAGEQGPRRAYFAGGAVLFCLCVAALVAALAVQDPQRGLARVLGWGPLAYLGRISYGIYLWHWPYAVWLLPPTGFVASRAALVVVATVVTAALSFHLIETPLRTSRFARARPRVVLASSAALLMVTTGVAVAAGRVPLDTMLAARGTPSATVLVVGDSVVQRLLPDLADAGMDRNLIVSSASRGGCSVIGAVTVTDDGSPLDPPCSDMPKVQTAELERTRPDIVLWWSRYELADRFGPDGRVLRASDQAFWDLQAKELAKSVARLTATGATLVIVAPDRPGPGIYSQCTPERCESFLTRLASDSTTRARWTALLRAQTADPRVRMITIDDTFCRDTASPCDDRMPVRAPGEDSFAPATNQSARPDGSHFTKSAALTVAAVLLDRMREAADQPVSGP